jgi:hypothetical protein
MEYEYIEIPSPKAQWWNEIDAFALTYNAYDRNGGFEVVATLDEQVRQAWKHDETLPDDVDICRAVLFFEQRRFRSLDSEPEGDDDKFVRAVLGQIRDLSGGRVVGPPDDLP